MPEEVPLLGVEIRDVAHRRLVTLIEIFSPVNKRGTGAVEYAERRIELLADPHAHFGDRLAARWHAD